MRTSRRTIITTMFAGVAAAIASRAAAQTGKAMTTASGLQIIDSKEGTGASPKPGQTCVMHYTGWLYENGQKGKKFDSSVDRNEPFDFPIGQGRVIKGWDEGVATMKVGGKRTLIIPPALGYGARGAGRRDPAERDADVRRRIAGGEMTPIYWRHGPGHDGSTKKRPARRAGLFVSRVLAAITASCWRRPRRG